jgi:hypothetical protein
MPKPDGDGNKSTQKLKGHDSYASQTEDSHDSGSPKKYNSGAKSGSGGAKSDPDGVAPAAGPKGYTRNND